MSDLYPWEYTDREGGTFKSWTAGPVTKADLSQRSLTTVIIKGKQVHSLIFETAAAYICGDVVPRWDCVNGWTKTIRQAKKLWPEGLHGKKPKFLYKKGGD